MSALGTWGSPPWRLAMVGIKGAVHGSPDPRCVSSAASVCPSTPQEQRAAAHKKHEHGEDHRNHEEGSNRRCLAAV